MTPATWQRAWPAAADVVETVARGRTLRDAMADAERLRSADAPLRAAVARLASDAIAAARRHEFVLAGEAGLGALPVAARAHALVAAVAVVRRDVSPARANDDLAAIHARSLPFATLLDADARVGAVADPLRRFALRHSLPDWFAARALASFGADADAVARALAEPAPRTVRANVHVVHDRATLAAELASEGVATRPAQLAATALHVDGDADLFATRAYRRGAFEQQDEASQLAAALVLPPPGGRVLDLCAGSGGKTLAIAAALQNRGVVFATDVHAGRLAALRARAARAGADNVQAVALGDPWPAPVVEFAARADRIVVDAPCSGTGTWRRRPEARWAFGEDAVASLRTTQDTLLARAAAALQPGARLVYMTCSLLREENEERVEHLRARQPGLELVRVAELLGSAAAAPITDASGTFLSLRPDVHGCDGFFAAVLRRPRARGARDAAQRS